MSTELSPGSLWPLWSRSEMGTRCALGTGSAVVPLQHHHLHPYHHCQHYHHHFIGCLVLLGTELVLVLVIYDLLAPSKKENQKIRTFWF